MSPDDKAQGTNPESSILMAALQSTLGTISLLQESSMHHSDLGSKGNSDLIHLLNEIDGKVGDMKLKYAKQLKRESDLQSKLHEAHHHSRSRAGSVSDSEGSSSQPVHSGVGQPPRRRMSITEEDVRMGLASRAHRVSIGVRRSSARSVVSPNQARDLQKFAAKRASNPAGNLGGTRKTSNAASNYGGGSAAANYGGAKKPSNPASNYGGSAEVPTSKFRTPGSGAKVAPTTTINPEAPEFHDFSSSQGEPKAATPKKSPGVFSMAGPPRLEEVDTPVTTPKIKGGKGGKGFAYSSLTPTNKSANTKKKGFGMSGPPSATKAKELEKPANPETSSDTTEGDSDGTAGNGGTQQPADKEKKKEQPEPATSNPNHADPNSQQQSPDQSPKIGKRTPRNSRDSRLSPSFLGRRTMSPKLGLGRGGTFRSTVGFSNTVSVKTEDSMEAHHASSNLLRDTTWQTNTANIGVPLFAKVDKDKVHEAQLAKEELMREERKKMAKEAFKVIDANGDGFLTKHEVLAALKKMNAQGVSLIPATMEAVEKMMSEVDEDGDGQIDKEEFANMMIRTQSMIGQKGNGDGSHPINGRMSVLARNVLLAHERVREKDNTIGRDYWLIHPQDWKHAFWDVVVSLLIMITVVTMPLGLGWECINASLYEVNLIVDTLFMCDVVKNFITGYVDDNESIVMDRYLVFRNYVFGYFVIDIVSSFPIDPILDIYGAGDDNSNCEGGFTNSTSTGTNAGSEIAKATKGLKMLKLLRMAKLFRLLRLSRVFRYIKMGVVYLEEKAHIRISDGFTKLIKLAIGVLLICHWIGSFNFMICRLHDFPEDSWVVNADLVGESPRTQWTWSFFKALAMMIMIGFETPPFTNVNCEIRSDWCGIENWITLGCLYIGAVFYSLLISSVASILNSANMSSRIFEEKLGKLDDYMRSQKLPAALREKVKDHFHMQHSDGKLFDEEEILGSVTPILRREIVSYKNREILLKVPLLQTTEENHVFAREVCTKLRSEIVFMDETVIREDTTGNAMFFISSGVIEIYLNSAADLTYVAVGDGCYFGEVSIILNCKRTASARTKTQCLLYRLDAPDLKKLLNDFEDQNDYMHQVAKARQKRIVTYLGLDDEEDDRDEDDQDEEDAKTDLFGTDADEMMIRKDQEFEKYRAHARISVRASHHNNGDNRTQSKRHSESGSASGIESFRNRGEVQRISRARHDLEEKRSRRNTPSTPKLEDEGSGNSDSNNMDHVIEMASRGSGSGR